MEVQSRYISRGNDLEDLSLRFEVAGLHGPLRRYAAMEEGENRPYRALRRFFNLALGVRHVYKTLRIPTVRISSSYWCYGRIMRLYRIRNIVKCPHTGA